jgi:hypothetical protein
VRRRKRCAALLAFAISHAPAPAAAAEGERAYAIAIGYNGLPNQANPDLESLRFADDDAIAFYSFVAPTLHHGHLLTIVDADTQRRLGDLMPADIRAPTLGEIRSAVADVRRAIEEDARQGIRTTVYLYYSGHGTDSDGHEPALALVDGDLTRAVLYTELLAALPATRIHLFVDACHAEAVVRPRDAKAEVKPLTNEDRVRYSLSQTLARFANVGAIVGSTSGAQAHEWELYQGGVFTHELLSGLRGGADVNDDGRVEYSELAAFLSAANRDVRDPRAHLDAVVHPIATDPRAPIVDLNARRDAAILEGTGERLGKFSIEDDRGDRIADVHPERTQTLRLLVPAQRKLFLRGSRGEIVIQMAPGSHAALDAMRPGAPSIASRGSIESALHDGLFATAFGRAYYRGFVDRGSDLVPVPIANDAPPALSASVPEAAPRTQSSPRGGLSRMLPWVVGGSGAAAVFLGGAFALAAKSQYDKSAGESGTARHDDSLRASQLGDTATVVMGVGGALIATGVVFWFVTPRASVSVGTNGPQWFVRGTF